MDTDTGLGNTAPRTLSIGAAFSVGWAAMKAQYGVILLALLSYILLVGAIILVQYAVEAALHARGWLNFPIAVFVTGPLATGLGYFGVRCVRGQAVKTGDIFVGFGRYWVVVGIQAVEMLVAGLFMAPSFMIGWFLGALGALRGGALVGPLLLLVILFAAVVVVILVMVRLSFAGLAAVDEEAPRPGVIVALMTSWRMTRSPNWGLLFVVTFLIGLISIACALALLLPLFLLAMPLGITVWGATYDLLADWTQGAPAPTA